MDKFYKRKIQSLNEQATDVLPSEKKAKYATGVDGDHACNGRNVCDCRLTASQADGIR